MRINRVVIKNLNNISSLDITFSKDQDNFFCLTGANGCGKSTVLMAIADLWVKMESPAKPNNFVLSTWGKHDVFYAIEIHGFIDSADPVWIFYSDIENWHHIVPEILHGIWFGFISNKNLNYSYKFIHSEHHEFARDWQYHYLSALTNENHLLGNVVYLNSENIRILPPHTDSISRYLGEPDYRWFVDDTLICKEGRLEGFLYYYWTVKPIVYNIIVEEFSDFLIGKTLVGFFPYLQELLENYQTKRLYIQIGTDVNCWHLISKLSLSEQRCLVILFAAMTFMRRGGVLIIDEPALQLSPSLHERFMRSIKKIVDSQDCQLIIASQSDKILEGFDVANVFHLPDIVKG